jgi:DNA-binding transcriptional ArsR family regulator
VSASTGDYESGLDPKAKAILDLLRANPAKSYTVMDLYGALYAESEKSAHLTTGLKDVFGQIQGWLNEFKERGYVKSKVISTSFYYSAVA